MDSEELINEDYNVELDSYKGPLDLLLYLIRRTEVDIYDIPIAEITTQYLSYIELMQQVNITIAGDFVLMAATLMEIKSKTLLPREVIDEPEDDEGDPRMELVRQLLEYKRFKDAARMLEDAEEEQSHKFPRPPLKKTPLRFEPQEEEDVFEGVTLWDLLTAFSKVLKETNLNQPRTIIETDKPLKYFMLIVLEALREVERLQFADLFSDVQDRQQVIGIFLAMLELIRLRRVKIDQVKEFGTIYIVLGEDNPEEELPDDSELGYDAGGNDEEAVAAIETEAASGGDASAEAVDEIVDESSEPTED